MRGDKEDVYDWVDNYLFKNEDKESMIIDHVDREDGDVFVHLMTTRNEVYCEKCDIILNSEKQYNHHIIGRKHLCFTS